MIYASNLDDPGIRHPERLAPSIIALPPRRVRTIRKRIGDLAGAIIIAGLTLAALVVLQGCGDDTTVSSHLSEKNGWFILLAYGSNIYVQGPYKTNHECRENFLNRKDSDISVCVYGVVKIDSKR